MKDGKGIETTVVQAQGRRELAEQLAGKDHDVKGGKSQPITSSSPRTVLGDGQEKKVQKVMEKDARTLYTCDLHPDLKVKKVEAKVIVGGSRRRKPLCERHKHDW